MLDLSYGDGQLWSGNKEGKLHLIDARHGLFDETTMQVLKSFSIFIHTLTLMYTLIMHLSGNIVIHTFHYMASHKCHFTDGFLQF